uniref:NFX1-type zinc finger-containing protein 1-like isoform X2 n=1 Tax=Geotrypetes seraphini TaxID=260995 RepID=A0A6P8PNP1_GEOSA|nr:NFX1-type zinc finger-containing protein 1-like isoform X2 [Geotrypetes seraphini]
MSDKDHEPWENLLGGPGRSYQGQKTSHENRNRRASPLSKRGLSRDEEHKGAPHRHSKDSRQFRSQSEVRNLSTRSRKGPESSKREEKSQLRVFQEGRPGKSLFQNRSRSEQNLLDRSDDSRSAGSSREQRFKSPTDHRNPRGFLGRDNSQIHRKERRLDYKSLKEISLMESSEIVMKLAAPGSGLSEFMKQKDIQCELIELILEILDKAIGCRTSRQNLQHVLSHVQDSTFLQQVLPFYVMELRKRETLEAKIKTEASISCIVTLLLELISIFPSSCATQVSLVNALLVSSISDLQITLSENMENKLSTLHTCLQHLQEKKREGTLKSNNYTYLMRNDQDSNMEDFRQIPIFPTYDDIYLKENPIMRPNIISSTYLDANVYLDTHFRLLREDFIRPLRDGIAQIVCYQGKEMMEAKFDDVRIYSGTRLIAPVCTRTGIVHRVQFEIEKLKAVIWESSKRLLFGALVCLSKDNFKTMLFATVADRDIKDLINGIVTLNFTNESRLKLAQMNVDDMFLMVETTAYFEAYRHVLEGLKEMISSEIPFQNYIVHCETDVLPPQYLMRNRHEYSLKMLICEETLKLEPVFETESSSRKRDITDNLCKLMDELTAETHTTKPASQLTQKETMHSAKFDILDFKTWPSKEHLNLDESQIKALQLALTKELSIIQGPPGTGKTYLGLKIVKALLANSHVWQSSGQSPILVVCYTNHALDQFLEGIYTFLGHGIVRVGSRSNSEIIKKSSLHYFRTTNGFMNRFPGHLRAMHGELLDQKVKIEAQIQEKAAYLENSMKGIIRENILRKYIPQDQLRSLMSVKSFEDSSVIMEWLGISMLEKRPGNINYVQERKISTAYDEDLPSEFLELSNMVEEFGIHGDPSLQLGEDLIHVVEEAEQIQYERMMESDDIRKQINESKCAAALKKKHMLAFLIEEENEYYEDTGVTIEGGEGAWEITKEMKKKLKNLVKHELKKSYHMAEEESEEICDLWKLPFQKRWELYRLWRFNYIANIRHQIYRFENEYQQVVDRMNELRYQEDLLIMKEAYVIGMTTTGASKYRKVLQEIGPKIIIVEEAAEVLEAHIVTTLSSKCEHLILIGDHQQLRPSATVYELAKNFNLEVSMFERLVRMNVHYVRLDYQHRMRSEIAKLLTPHIYDKLENHASVYQYERIKGVATNLFFVQHEHLEEHIREGKSHKNVHEAAFVKSLCRYFINQGYNRSQITVLTTYSGQLHCLRKLMPKADFEGVRVCVVDKYQGEENDIILLSLVRSNIEGRAGFLQIPNRICVALSRAKKGLFCIGNMKMLSGILLWSKIMDVLTQNGHIGKELKLCCENHPNHTCNVSKAEDFSKVPEGGCMDPCEYRMTCGHVCPLTCHPYDPEHKEIMCIKPCVKILCEDGHKCEKQCFKECGSCQVLVKKVIPKCEHIQDVPCSVLPQKFSCREPCPRTLSCGHRCIRFCGEKCTFNCPEKLTEQLECGHSKVIMCYEKQEAENKGKRIQCSKRCLAKLECGHFCGGTCSKCSKGQLHVVCVEQCNIINICSHRCEAACSEDCIHCLCSCENKCFHRVCSGKCSDPCSPCTKPCGWKCKHSECTNLCYEPCNRDPCNMPCLKKLHCSHPCIGLCADPCPQKCRDCDAPEVNELFFGKEADPESRFIQLRDCKHIFEVTEFTKWMNQDDGDGIIKLKCCPKCLIPIRHNLRYGEMIKRTLADIEVVKKEIVKIWTNQLEEFLTENENNLNYFSCITEAMENLMNLGATIRSITLISEKINYFSKMGKIKRKAEQLSLLDQRRVNKKIDSLCKLIEKATSKMDVLKEQPNLFRMALFVESCCLKKTTLAVNCISSHLISAELTEEEIKEIHDQITKMSSVPLYLVMQVQDKKGILDTRVLRQGHWCKCSGGHIFSTLIHHSCPQCSSKDNK